MLQQNQSMSQLLSFFNLGGGEIILILALVLILFGGRKLPDMSKGLGHGIHEFKKALRPVADRANASAGPEDVERNQLILHGITALLLILLGIAVLSFLTAIL